MDFETLVSTNVTKMTELIRSSSPEMTSLSDSQLQLSARMFEVARVLSGIPLDNIQFQQSKNGLAIIITNEEARYAITQPRLDESRLLIHAEKDQHSALITAGISFVGDGKIATIHMVRNFYKHGSVGHITAHLEPNVQSKIASFTVSERNSQALSFEQERALFENKPKEAFLKALSNTLKLAQAEAGLR